MIPDGVQVLAAAVGLALFVLVLVDVARDVVTRHRFMVAQRRRMRRRA